MNSYESRPATDHIVMGVIVATGDAPGFVFDKAHVVLLRKGRGRARMNAERIKQTVSLFIVYWRAAQSN